ncbi:hypothetical protein FACS1894113_3650 [Alphaproteobacteria bacterium]|nr:hypothetical protein FACS1894113_3650 [Alphaproteobacteria bacterium]
MNIMQNDIFGEKHSATPEKAKKPASEAPKKFRNVSLLDGINEKEATGDAMLIHRILQRKAIYSGLSSEKMRKIFLKIFLNELLIKAGKNDAATSVRDSLFTFFIQNGKP